MNEISRPVPRQASAQATPVLPPVAEPGAADLELPVFEFKGRAPISSFLIDNRMLEHGDGTERPLRKLVKIPPELAGQVVAPPPKGWTLIR